MADDQKKEAAPQKQKPLTWRAAEYEYAEKDLKWYALICGVALILLVLALWQRNFFFAIFVVLATVVVISLNRRRPRTIDFVIDEGGISAGTTKYQYEELEWFALRTRPGRLDMLTLRKKSTMMPFTHIPIDSGLAVKAREFVGEKLPEQEYEESLVDTLANLFGL